MSAPGDRSPGEPALEDSRRGGDVPADRAQIRTAVWLVVVVVAVIKALVLIEDSTPRFFMGDSGSYLRSALTGVLPPDRSYTYGHFLLRPLAVWPASLTPVVVAQAAAAAAACVIVSLVLMRSLDVRPTIAAAAAIVHAADPLQLMLERQVLTETFALLCLALFVMMGASYIRRPALATLAGTHAVGIALVSLRTLYVPVTLVSALLLPVLAWISFGREPAPASGPAQPGPRRAQWTRAAGHLAASAAIAWGLHDGYQRVTGWLADRPPAYQYQDGLFLVAMVAPLLTPADALTPDQARIIDQLRPSMQNVDRRAMHRWSPDGLVGRLHRAVGRESAANDAAREIAWNAIRRDPGGVMRLTGRTYAQYWEPERRRMLAAIDAGRRPLRPAFERLLRIEFGYRVEPGEPRQSFAQRHLQQASRLWLDAALLTPLVALTAPIVCRRRARAAAVFVALLVWSIAAVTFGVAGVPTLRYLHPFGLLCSLTAAVVVDGLLARRGATDRSGS